MNANLAPISSGEQALQAKHELAFNPIIQYGNVLIKWAGIGSTSAAILIWSTLWISGSHAATLGNFCLALFFPCILLAEWYFLYRRLASRRIRVFDDHLEFVNIGKVDQYPFADLQSLGLKAHIPMLGGSLKITRKDGASFWLPMTLERCDLLLDALAAARPDLISNTDAFFSYRRTAIVSDRSLRRMRESVVFWKRTLVRNVLLPLPLTLLLLFKGEPILPALGFHLWAFVFAAFLGTLCYGVCEAIAMYRDRKYLLENPSVDSGSRDFEEILFRRGRKAHVILSLALSLFLVGLAVAAKEYGKRHPHSAPPAVAAQK